MPHVHHHHHLIFTILFFTFRFTCGGEKDTHTKREREREREIMWSGSKYIGLVIKQTLIYFSSCSLWFIFDDYLVSEEMYVIEKDKGYGVMESKTRRPLSLSSGPPPNRFLLRPINQHFSLFLSLFPIF